MYLCIRHAGLAVWVEVEAVAVDVFPRGGSTPVRLLLLQLGQRQRPDRVHEAFLLHVSAHGRVRTGSGRASCSLLSRSSVTQLQTNEFVMLCVFTVV